jgi:hypothetical protein
MAQQEINRAAWNAHDHTGVGPGTTIGNLGYIQSGRATNAFNSIQGLIGNIANLYAEYNTLGAEKKMGYNYGSQVGYGGAGGSEMINLQNYINEQRTQNAILQNQMRLAKYEQELQAVQNQAYQTYQNQLMAQQFQNIPFDMAKVLAITGGSDLPAGMRVPAPTVATANSLGAGLVGTSLGSSLGTTSTTMPNKPTNAVNTALNASPITSNDINATSAHLKSLIQDPLSPEKIRHIAGNFFPTGTDAETKRQVLLQDINALTGNSSIYHIADKMTGSQLVNFHADLVMHHFPLI